MAWRCCAPASGMVLEPLVGAQRVGHFEHRQRAVLERDAGVLGLRAFLVGRHPHQAGEAGRASSCRRRSTSRRGPTSGARAHRPRASSRHAKMRSPTPLGPRPVWKSIQPRRAQRRPCSRSTCAQRQVAPGRLAAAVEQAIGVVVLAAATPPTGSALSPCCGDVALHRIGGVGARRPVARARSQCAISS